MRATSQSTDLNPDFERLLFEASAAPFRRRDGRTIDLWAADNIEMGTWSPWPGKISFEHTPWLIEPLRSLSRITCHRITIVAAAAGGKSTIGEVFAAHCIAEAPGYFCWFAQTEQAAKEFAESRINQMLANCEKVKRMMPADRHKVRNSGIIFDHMTFLVLPANVSSAQSKHIRYLVADEPWLYAPGMLMQLHKRTTKFAHNRKILELSTGSLAGDEVDQAWNAGTRKEWQFKCPECGGLHVPIFSPDRLDVPGGVRWSPDSKRGGGAYDFDKVRKTAYYQCPLCAATFKPTEENQHRLNLGGCYTSGAEDAEHESYHWPAWVSDFRLLPDFAVEFLQAKQALRRGTTELLQEFTQKREASAWDSSKIDAEPIELIESTYDMGDPWDEAEMRCMTVDVQKHHLWALVRDWKQGPESRLVWAGKVMTWDELRQRQLEFGVEDRFVFVDSSHFTELVYGQCCRFDWNAIKGEKAVAGFVVESEGMQMRVPVSASNSKGKPAQLPPDARYNACELFRVSEEMTAASLHLFRTGRAKGWTIPRNPPAEYSEQMAARVRRSRQHKLTGQTIWEWITVGKCGEHLWDCERYQLAAAFLAEKLEGKIIDTKEESKQ